MKWVHHLRVVVLALAAVGIQSTAGAEPVESSSVTLAQARQLRSVINSARQRLDSLIVKARGGSFGPTHEMDAPALNLLLMAGSNLNTAGEQADTLNDQIAANPLDPQAPITFARACSHSAVSRSQVARARLAAASLPVENLLPSDPQFPLLVGELQGLRSPPPLGVGCP